MERQPEEVKVRALGLWEVAKSSAPSEAILGPFLEADGEYFGVWLTGVPVREGESANRCVEESGVQTGVVTILKLVEDGFVPFQEIGLVDEWVSTWDEPLLALDLTRDGVDEVILRSDCLANPVLSALRLEGGKWIRVELRGATSVVGGVLIGFSEDCTPSCADGGVIWTAYEWNGREIVPGGYVTSEGQPVNLSVEMGCGTFAVAASLPIQQCAEGPLVRKFLVLARSVIGDYSADASVSHAVDRFDDRVARWVLTYRYRHGLPITKDIDGELFAALGSGWNPESPDQRDLFERFCEGGNPLMCEYGERQIGFLFPTEECPNYRPATGDWPIQRCDFEGWVGVLAAALESFDGKEFESSGGAAVFDSRLEARVRDFQRAAGLEVDGYVGRNTWRALYAMPGSPLRGWDDLNGDGMFGPGDVIPH